MDQNGKAKWQYPNVYNYLLPYGSQIDNESQNYFKQIKENLCRGIVLLEEQTFIWFKAFYNYLSFYKHHFTKEDHIFFIQLFYEFIFSENYNSKHFSIAIDILTTLLQHRSLITNDELTLDWRISYDFIQKYVLSKNARIGLRSIPSHYKPHVDIAAYYAKPYFSLEATEQILEKFRPRLCPFSDTEMSRTAKHLDLYLPTIAKVSDHDKTWKLWFNELTTLWQSFRSSKGWEESFISLFSLLGDNMIGYVDWTPHAPLVFEALHRTVQTYDSKSMDPLIIWVVSMIDENNKEIDKHIRNLFGSLEIYYYPTNSQDVEASASLIFSNCINLLKSFTSYLIGRMHFERYRSNHWYQTVPEKNKITDRWCAEFTKMLMPLLLKAMFSNVDISLIKTAFRNLALISPHLVIEPLKQTFFNSVETVTEPHRLGASIECLSAVARVMIEHSEKPDDIIKILKYCLLAVDINDLGKTVGALNLMQMICVNVPFATSEFQEIAISFLDRIFYILDYNQIDSWTKAEGINDTVYVSTEDVSVQNAIKYTMGIILVQSSPTVFDAILDKLFHLVNKSIYETLVSGVLIGNFCRTAVQVDPEKTLAKFFPTFSNMFLKLTEDEKCFQEDHLDEQLIFNLCVLSYLCSTRVKFLLPYKENLLKVFDRVIQLKDRFAYTYISSTFRRLLVCSTNAMTVDFKSEPNNWGKPSDIEKLKINWSLPEEEDYQFVSEFLDKYLRQQLKYLQQWRQKEIKLKKSERLKSLNIINACVWGACSSIPPWKSEEVELNGRITGIKSDIFTEVGSKDIYFPNGENIRETVAVEMMEILQFILTRKESDTEAIKIVIDIYDTLLFSFGGLSDETTWISECIATLKPFLKNSLVRSRKHIRVLLVQKALKQHETRLSERKRSHIFTEMHKKLMFDLITLSLNHYKDVREKATSVLQNMFSNWPQCVSLAISECLKRLNESGSDDDSLFEGFLCLTCVRRDDDTPERLLIFHTDWATTKHLWLSLFKAKYRDKESIVQKIDQLSHSAANEHVDHSLHFMVHKKCRELALKAWSTGVSLDSKVPTDEEFDEAEMNSNAVLVENLGHYNDLVVKLVDLIKSHRLHWKYTDIAYCVLTTRIREDTDYPPEAIKLLLDSMNHDILSIRKQCIDAVGFLLQKQKRRHLKVKINEIDKESMQYKLNVDYLDEKIWESTIFVEKPFWGFYQWPKDDLFVYDADDKQPKVNRPLKEMTKAEKIIYKFFVSKKNIESLLQFLSLEETKGEDVIDESRVSLFKRLSRNYGISVFKHIKGDLSRLVESDEESEQRCAAEIVTGLVRGSKHWSLKEVKDLKEFLSPIIETMLNKLTDETSLDWTIFCGSCFLNRDPRKLSWILDLVLEKAISHKNTFSNAISLQCLKEIIAQHSWRSVSLRKHLLTVLEPKLTEDYHDLRTKVGILLQSIFEFDNNFFGHTLKDSPSSSEFIDGVVKQLKVYSDDDAKEDDRKKCINLLKTVVYWVLSSFLLNVYPMQPQFYRLFPIYFEGLKETKDVELQMEVENTIYLYSICTTTKQSTVAAMEACETILNSKSWKSRQKLASYLAYQITGNLYQIIAFSKQILRFSKILIEDKNVEVRTAAMLTLKTAIQNKVIEVDQQLLQYYKTKCETPLKQSNENDSVEENRNDLREKHSGFLALSAIVEAYPFDIPPFVPDILVYLSEHLNEPWLIRKTIKSTFKQFRETHYDNWREHETKFTSVQLHQLEDLLVSPSYYG